MNTTGKNLLLPAILLFAVTSFSNLEILAQKGIVKFDYEYKSNAEGKLKAGRNRGKAARMFYDKAVRCRAVEVKGN